MVGKLRQKAGRLPLGARIVIYILATITLVCGAAYLCFYLIFRGHYLRAEWVAAQAQHRVEHIFNQLQEDIPNGAALVSTEAPRSGTYAWGLSDGSPRYAAARAQQGYTAVIPFSEALAFYTEKFSRWGWTELSLGDETALISSAFSPPDDENFIVGICLPPDNLSPSTQYTVFFVFDESQVCEGHRTWLGCIAARYCKPG